jgi:hypothetical protein
VPGPVAGPTEGNRLVQLRLLEMQRSIAVMPENSGQFLGGFVCFEYDVVQTSPAEKQAS